ncbi:MAG: hypothetical protein ABEJ98_03535 [Candidatus Nanohaloarchaea archaeon]
MAISEEDTHPEVASELEKRLDDNLTVESGKRIEYTLEYDSDKEVKSRSFETDVCVLKNGVPQVILEVKRKKATTHDLRVYSTKAETHKQVYPYLQYGMLVLEAKNTMTKRYIWHGEDFDFLYFSEKEMESAEDLDSEKMDELADIIENNIQKGQKLKDINDGKRKPKAFDRELKLK